MKDRARSSRSPEHRDYRRRLADQPSPPRYTLTGNPSDPGPCWVYDLTARRRGSSFDTRAEAVAACAALNVEAAR